MKVSVHVTPPSRMRPPIEVRYAGDIYQGVGPVLCIRDGVLDAADVDTLRSILVRARLLPKEQAPHITSRWIEDVDGPADGMTDPGMRRQTVRDVCDRWARLAPLSHQRKPWQLRLRWREGQCDPA